MTAQTPGEVAVTDGIVVVGGGFAGFWAAAAARRVAGADVPISLVSPQPSLVMRPRLYEANPDQLAVALPPLLAELDVTFVADAAVGIGGSHAGSGRRTLVLASGQELPFGRLVVATGSVMQRPPVPGAEQAWSIDTQADAVELDRHLGEIAAGGGAAPVVVVIGAGFTGIELALELRDRLAAHGAAAAAEAMRIVLVDRAEVVGPELGEGPRPVIEQALRDGRVELRLGTGVQRLSKHEVELAGGEVLAADAVVLTTGLRAAPFTEQLPGRRDAAGRIIVDQHLRAPEAPDVFVTGDAAAADTGDGHLALASCQHALQLGRFAGENAARDLLGLPLVPYQQLRYVTCLDLGRSGAVLTQGWDRAVTLTGAEAKARKTFINGTLIYPPAEREELLRQSELELAARTT
jgi:NADH dehydrogenase